MKKTIDCAFCDGIAILKGKHNSISFRKEQFEITEHFFKCSKCSREFTTTETDTLSLLQVHNQYREKYGILFVEEIVEIREKYGLSASKMSEILGLGINSYSNFERGEVPSAAIGNYLGTIGDPEVFLTLFEKGKNLFSDKVYEKTRQRILDLKLENRNVSIGPLNWFNKPNVFTGFRKVHCVKLENLIKILIKSCRQEFNDRLKLNKLLFYTDFLNYKENGASITGLTYRAIPYGPAPTYYDNILAWLMNEEVLISNWIKDENNAAHEVFEVQTEGNIEVFTTEERETIETIIKKLKDISSWDLVDLSHQETAWKVLEAKHELINYQEYAFVIQGVS